MKKIIILILVILLCGCGNKNKTIINLNKNLNIEVGESVYLYDLVNIENGSFITKNYLIDTNKIYLLLIKQVTIKMKSILLKLIL